LVLLLNLHLSHKLVLILYFLLDLLKELRDFSVSFLLQEVYLLVLWELRCYKEVDPGIELPARMFSTALATMKFLSETSPWIGFSSFFGTGGFLTSSVLLNGDAKKLV
jgi:hypothetical protein